MAVIANYSVPNLGQLRQRPSVPNANFVVAKPYPIFAVPPTNHVLGVSSAAESSINVLVSTDTTRRWIATAGTPLVGYQPPSGGAPFLGLIAIDTVAQSVHISINTAGTSSDWINITGNGAGTAL